MFFFPFRPTWFLTLVCWRVVTSYTCVRHRLFLLLFFCLFTSYWWVFRISVKWSRFRIGFELSSHPTNYTNCIIRGNNIYALCNGTNYFLAWHKPPPYRIVSGYFFLGCCFVYRLLFLWFGTVPLTSNHCYTYIRYSGVGLVCSNCIKLLFIDATVDNFFLVNILLYLIIYWFCFDYIYILN